MNLTNSRNLFKKASKVVPSGVHSNARIRQPHPIYYKRAHGARVWDVDGNEYLDCIMGHGAVILGHGDSRVQENVANTLKSGVTCGIETELSVKVAERICDLMGGKWKLRFCNSGTEASLHALRVARAITGKQKIAKVEGSYHGWSDSVSVSIWPEINKAGSRETPKSLPGTNGLLTKAVENTIVLPFNNEDKASELIETNKNELAAIILEPVLIDIGYIPATFEYLKSLREISRKNGILLIFDELLTGFRMSLGGAQQYYGVKPDLVMLGKAISNGYPLAAIAGDPLIMEEFGENGSTNYNGTFNGHQVSLAAAEATLEILSSENILQQLDKNTTQLQNAFEESAKKFGIDAFLAGGAGHFQPYFTGEKVYDYRSAATTDPVLYKIFMSNLTKQGLIVSMNPLLHHAISAAHDQSQLEFIIEMFDESMKIVSVEMAKRAFS